MMQSDVTQDSRGQFIGRHGGKLVSRVRKVMPFHRSYFVTLPLLYGVLQFADYPNIMRMGLGGYGSVVKYLMFMVLFGVFAALVLKRMRVRFRWDGPTIFFGFTLVALVPFLIQLFSGQELSSYISAFAASMIFSMAMVFDLRQYKFDAEKICNLLLAWLCLMGVLYIFELLIRNFLPGLFPNLTRELVNHPKSLVYAAALSLALLSDKKNRVIFFILACAAMSMALRPSSSLLLALVVSGPVALAIRFRRYRLAQLVSYGIIVSVMIIPFILHFSTGVQQMIIDVERYVKVDIFNSTSNAGVRLAMFDLVFARISTPTLWLVGDLFAGDTNVLVGSVLSFWLQNNAQGVGAVHSDFLVVLMEGGLIGYAMFNVAFLLIIRMHFLALRNNRAGDAGRYERALVAFACPLVLILIVYCSANPFLQVFSTAFVLWFLLFCSELALLYVTSRKRQRV